MGKNTDDSQPATRKDVEEIVSSVVGEALKVIGAHFQDVYHKFEVIDRRFDQTDERLDSIDTSIIDSQDICTSIRTDVSDIRLSQARLERKVDVNINRTNSLAHTVGGHDRQLKTLHPKTT